MNARRTIAVLALLCAIPRAESVAQPEPRDSTSQLIAAEAHHALAAGAWARSAELYESALLKDDRVAEHWYAYGTALYRSARYQRSVAAFERALQLGDARTREGALQIARAYARMGNDVQASRWLERAVQLERAARPAAADERRPGATGERRA
jgi:Tfp pilus assembly protein PilF